MGSLIRKESLLSPLANSAIVEDGRFVIPEAPFLGRELTAPGTVDRRSSARIILATRRTFVALFSTSIQC